MNMGANQKVGHLNLQSTWDRVFVDDLYAGIWRAFNQHFVFSDNLQQYGFQPTIHQGYVKLIEEIDGWIEGYPTETNAFILVYSDFPEELQRGVINKTFTCSDNEDAWFVMGTSNYCDYTHENYDRPDLSSASGLTDYTLMHTAGGFWADDIYGRSYYFPDSTPEDYTVLSTLSLPPVNRQVLVMDYDRDGAITTNDLYRTDQNHPYRFWVNEDGNDAEYEEADLEDFFSGMLKGSESTQTFKLSANVDMSFIITTMATNNSQEYLHDIDLAQSLAGQIQTLDAGDQTYHLFSENEIVLLAASEANTNAEIYVHILDGGTETSISTNYFSFTSVTNMYRIKNFREGGVTSNEEPNNWPDELTNGKDLVYVHGFNVKDEMDPGDLDPEIDTPARMWHRNIFKRLWLAGSNAKYHGVIWDGIGQGSLATHYQNSVINAFATARWLATYLQSLSSTETIILGHSLGNMVVSSAICEYGAPVAQYYAIDAAVALEAYGDVEPNPAFVPDTYFTWEQTNFFNYVRSGWQDYPHETWASEWYQLFTNEVADARANLTFRHKFADIQNQTDVFNFYSSTEDILRVRDDIHNILQLIDWSSVRPELRFHLIPLMAEFDTPCAWQFQEMYKGLKNWAATTLGGGSSQYAGWGFTKQEGEHLNIIRKKKAGSHPATFEVNRYAESTNTVRFALSTAPENTTNRTAYLELLQSDPLFRREPEILFDVRGPSFVNGTVGQYDHLLDYDNAEILGGPDIDVSNVLVRDWLLAKAFPSRTGPMGSSENIKWPLTTANFDMFSIFRTDPLKWPIQDSDNNKLWRHSDWKNAPYVHVYKLFNKITGKDD